MLAAAAYLRDACSFGFTAVFAAIIFFARHLTRASRMLTLSVFISHARTIP
jgi:hypothetical protein